MSKIDFSRARSLQDVRAEEIKRECGTRIQEVLDTHTLLNIQAAILADVMSKADRAKFAKAQGWVASMLSESRNAAAEGRAPKWPNLPKAVEQLARLY